MEKNNVVTLHAEYLGPMAKVITRPNRKSGPLTLDELKAAVKIEIEELVLPTIGDAALDHLIEATLYQLAYGVTQANGADFGFLGRFESITHEVANTYTYHPFGDPDDAA